jgi:hypothetical protein
MLRIVPKVADDPIFDRREDPLDPACEILVGIIACLIVWPLLIWGVYKIWWMS